MKNKTLGQKLMDSARKNNVVDLTEHYWGSRLTYDDGRYIVEHFRQQFGGMGVYKRNRIPAADLRECDTVEALESLLCPENDAAPGDPMNYTPREIRRVSLEISGIDL